MDTNKYYNWVEPTLIIDTSTGKTSHLLYNLISNFTIRDKPYKLVRISVYNDKSEYLQYKTGYRYEYAKYLKNLYPESYSLDNGFNAIIDAIKSTNEDLLLLFNNFEIEGAASYNINSKKRIIDIGHIGVIHKRCGYGQILMREIYNFSNLLQYKIEVTSNSYADPFYESCGMIKIVNKPLGIYSISKENIISNCDKLSVAIRNKSI